ncbi:MAG TPA: hypothetical protein VME17_23425 [Bryobacteraceae bacterium]|nr:hypothetical protein [Bryobacteraceae bacterium]
MIVKKSIFVGVVVLSVFLPAAHANPVSRRAIITGSGGNGRCTVEVSVDHSAEVEISGDAGWLTTVAGQPAQWRRFQCNAPLPNNPHDFRFMKTNGRGTVRLVQDPRSTGGRALIRINDPQGGRANYTFDLQWGRLGGGGWNPGPPNPVPGHGPGPGGFPVARAIRICQDAVTNRLNRDGYSYVTFERTIPNDQPGRHDWIDGRVTGRRGFETTRFAFSCSVDFGSGRVRSVDVRRP